MAILILAISSFLAATLLSQIAAGKLHADTRAILDDALPSIEHLAALRTELFHEELLLGRVSTAGSALPALRSELKAAQSAVQQEEAAYEGVPSLVGERPITIELRRQLDETERSCAQVLASAQSDEVLRQAEGIIDRAVATAAALLQLEAAKAGSFTRAIDAGRARTVLAGIVLDALSALLTVALAVMTWRTVRYYIEQQELQRRRLGLRAVELDNFAGRVAHDIISPLNAVGIALGLIQRGLSPKILVPQAQASLQRVDAIVEALLGLARTGGASPEQGAQCGAAEVLRGVIEDAAERAQGVALTVDVPDELEVACHAGVLASIAENLIGNAIKHFGSSAATARVAVRASSRGHRVRFEVEDNGPGIATDQQQAIFQPFVRGKAADKPGIGLGLATAKWLCEAHSGDIGVESAEGRGSIFWFELPLAKRNEAVLRDSGPQTEKAPVSLQ